MQGAADVEKIMLVICCKIAYNPKDILEFPNYRQFSRQYLKYGSFASLFSVLVHAKHSSPVYLEFSVPNCFREAAKKGSPGLAI